MASWLLALCVLAFSAAPRAKIHVPVLPASAIVAPRPVLLVTQASAARFTPSAPVPVGNLQALQILRDRLPDSRNPAATLEDFWSRQKKPAAALQDDLSRIVETANASATGRQILGAVAKLGAVPTVFADLKGNLGEYDYKTGILYLDKKSAAGDVRSAAATLIHELQHVLQHLEGLPAQALELELEAHALTLLAMEELGLEPGDGFSWRAKKKLAQGVDEYVEWVARQLPSKHRLQGRDYAALADALDAEADELEDKYWALTERLAKNLRGRGLTQWPALAADLEWARRDAALMRTSTGRRRMAALQKRLEALLQRAHSRYRLDLSR